MKIDNEIKLDFDDVLLVPQRSVAASRKQVELKRAFKFYHSPKEWRGMPLMAANMDTTGTFKMGSALNKHQAITCLHKHYDAEEIEAYFKHYNVEPNVWISIGMDWDRDLDKLFEIERNLNFSPNICIDIANGYTAKFVDWCSEVRLEFPDSIIMAGNVATPEMVSELIIHGEVDIVKVGIGPGSACTTRLKAGVGYPQLSAIAECSHVAHGLRSDSGRLGLICADGGCRFPADVAKAYAAGADFVMLGGMLAGTKECEGEWVDHAGTKYMTFYGMSSKKAQEKHGDGLRNYRSSEGRVQKICYKGKAEVVVNDILGGVRSACAYTGATSLKDFNKTARFVRVNRVHHDKTVEKL
tara:strand:- start:4393 stop:5457 length:1065 start_codon:yes stop_codon:yes gene_type:complete